MASDLAAILVPIGFVGAALAVLCAIVAAVAVARGAAGLAGGSVGLWIPAALLSSTASFSSEWLPLIVSGAALVGMLVLGGIARAVIHAERRDRSGRAEAKTTTTTEAESPAATPRVPSASTPPVATSTVSTPVVSAPASALAA